MGGFSTPDCPVTSLAQVPFATGKKFHLLGSKTVPHEGMPQLLHSCGYQFHPRSTVFEDTFSRSLLPCESRARSSEREAPKEGFCFDIMLEVSSCLKDRNHFPNVLKPKVDRSCAFCSTSPFVAYPQSFEGY